MVPGQVVGIIEADVHPGGPIGAAVTGEVDALFFLPGEKPDLVRLLYSCQDGLFQSGFRAKDLVPGVGRSRHMVVPTILSASRASTATGILIIAAPVC